MNLVYSPRSVQDLEQMAAYYGTVAGSAVAEEIGKRIEDVLQRLVQYPHIAPRVDGRSHVRVQLVSKYRYKIFYRVHDDAVEILHIRHTSRQSWKGE